MKLIFLIIAASTLATISKADTLIEEGRYIFQLANCYACHTDIENDGQILAGGRAMETEFGIFYTPNITADKETGIGLWTNEQFTNAIRSGISPDGKHYFPSFPYTAYKNITDQDISALKAYIFNLKTVHQKNKKHKLKWYVSRYTLPLWKMLNTDHENSKISEQRGAYLVDTLGHCNECHTPRNSIGILQMNRKLTGNEELAAPDISPQALKDWVNEELIDLFRDGALPDGDYVSDHMAEVVEFSTSNWNEQDLKSAIRYLRSNK